MTSAPTVEATAAALANMPNIDPHAAAGLGEYPVGVTAVCSVDGSALGKRSEREWVLPIELLSFAIDNLR
jgi:hypothetical protein